ncbi:tyrosine-type recombinase/integrase [Carboxylicivirga sp. N1Y90]|uniref:tyrosine-type recombinase/integrase n=1 Tax=Carboxylicivirga fragile TaxID=3417571 RepID=UPI003D324EA3|nr:site-specific integrase [Marinilabiliaceae bacterium N1Y90]
MANVNRDYQISIYLDTRRAKKNGKFPVKLRVFTAHPRKQKLYPTKFEFTEDEFDLIWHVEKPRGEKKDIKLLLKGLETTTYDLADSLDEFTFEDFELLISPNKVQEKRTVNEFYKAAIDNYRHNNKLTTATSYEYSLKSLIQFSSTDILHFKTITVQWLKDYQFHMESLGRSRTSIGIYLRNLKAIFNSAISDGVVKQEIYPFGKGRYQIPTSKKAKTALSAQDLKALLHGQPKTEEQEKAKAFWFFSYACNGMNVKDIADIKYKDFIDDDTFFYYRNKIRDTDVEHKPIIIYLNSFTNGVIQKYGNKKINQETFLFPIVTPEYNQEQIDTAVGSFNRFISQHMKKYAQNLGLNIKINSKIARHTFATNLIRKGAGMEMAQESLGHTDIKTTKAYFAGFADEDKRDIAPVFRSFLQHPL